MCKILTIFLFLSVNGFSQAFKARLFEANSRLPIEAATIYTNKGHSTQSDKEGYFSIPAFMNDSIFITSIGHLPLKLKVENFLIQQNILLIPSGISLKEVVVKAALGNALLNNLQKIDLVSRPINNSQELLRIVPGLFIGQHAGGGKAEQLFLRGFDVDHGTDVAISSDGLPVNMPSHAHGQGYADLHFVIPETVEKIDFGKGPYNAEKGDFNTAGYVSLNTYNHIAKNKFLMESGLFNTLRSVGLFKLTKTGNPQQAYIAGEAYLTDGPFDAPQQFKRYNLFAKHQFQFRQSTLTSQASTFKSEWLASGQIPERAIEEGKIGWFGAIDPNEGGSTTRTNFSTRLRNRLAEGSLIDQQVYFTRYDFTLYSNFTFFKTDPVNGDEIRQKENRTIIGYNGSYTRDIQLKDQSSLQFKAGFVFRQDWVKNIELSRTYKRNTITAPLAFGHVEESNTAAYVSQTFRNRRWNMQMAIRLENFGFQYHDLLNVAQHAPVHKTMLNPKLNVQYQASTNTAIYFKAGRGFHSNDARVVVPRQGVQTLPAAWGSDAGVVIKPTAKLLLNTAIWILQLNQEFIYVGDEAVVEPGGKTLRKGVDVSARYEITNGLFADLDLNYTLGKALDAPAGEQYLPLAPRFSSTGGLSYLHLKWNLGGRYRWLGDRAANEKNTQVAKGYTIAEAHVSYKLNNSWSLGLIADNLFNTKWKETQFLTESRLKNEISPVEEIHFTPGTPFFIKARISVEF